MKKNWIKPTISNLSVKNTEKDHCSHCNHPITHPENFLHPGNHKGWCPVLKCKS